MEQLVMPHPSIVLSFLHGFSRINTSGAKQKRLCKSSLTLHVFHMSNRLDHSVSLNSLGEPNMYQLLCGGPWFYVQAVMADDSVERLQQEFSRCVKRPEIKIRRVISKGVWRPNTRMAARFRIGRVFIAGGRFLPNPILPYWN